MEFTKDIYFDKNLTVGKETKITYLGELYKDNSNNVNIVYGFGENWTNTTTQPMQKTEDGFVANIKMRDFDTFNFCFSNENNKWDNNNCFNYISPILPDVKEFISEPMEDSSFDIPLNVEQFNENILNSQLISDNDFPEIETQINSSDNTEFSLDLNDFNNALEDNVLEVENNNLENNTLEFEDNNIDKNTLEFEDNNLKNNTLEFNNDKLENYTLDNDAPEFGKDYSASIDAIIDDILENTAKKNLIEEKDSIDKILETITIDTLPEIEKLFTELFCETVTEDENTSSPLQNISMDASLANELEEVGKALETNNFIEESQKDNTNIIEAENSISNNESLDSTNNLDSTILDEKANSNQKIIRLFNELFETADEPIQINSAFTVSSDIKLIPDINSLDDNISINNMNIENSSIEYNEPQFNSAAFNLDGLISDILEPVISSEITSNNTETSLFEDIDNSEIEQEKSLTVVNSTDFVISPRRLGYFYKLKKRIRLAFIKLSRASKEFIEQLGL